MIYKHLPWGLSQIGSISPASLLTYEDVEDPKPAAGEVLVRVSATSINPADWLVRSGAVQNIIPIEFP